MVSGWPTKFSATWHNTKSSTDSTEIENHAKKSRAKERSELQFVYLLQSERINTNFLKMIILGYF